MSRVAILTAEQALEPARSTLRGVGKKMGKVPALMGVLANSPPLLRGYLELRGAVAAGKLDSAIREQIAVAVASYNDCHHCLVAHTEFGRAAGLSDDELQAARQWSSSSSQAQAALTLARAMLMTAGRVGDGFISNARDLGLDDEAIVEIAVVVGMNQLTNMVNNLAVTN